MNTDQSMLIVLLAVVATVSSLQCRDKVDNLLHIEDCGSNDALHLTKAVIMTYDESHKPTCLLYHNKTYGQLTFPGSIVIEHLDGHIDRVLPFHNVTKAKMTLFKRDSLLGHFCLEGKSQSPLIEDSMCNPDACALSDKYLYKLCDKLEKAQGAITMDTLGFASPYTVKFPKISSALGKLANGVFDIKVELVNTKTNEEYSCLNMPYIPLHV